MSGDHDRRTQGGRVDARPGGGGGHERINKTIQCVWGLPYGRLAPMWQQSGTLLFCSCHGIARFLVDELQI